MNTYVEVNKKIKGISLADIQDKELYIVRIPDDLVEPSYLINQNIVIHRNNKTSNLLINDKKLEICTKNKHYDYSLMLPDDSLGSLQSVPLKISKQIFLKNKIEIKKNEAFDIRKMCAVKHKPSKNLNERNFYSGEAKVKKNKKRKRDLESSFVEENISNSSSKKKKRKLH